ncbi:hypothetical protein ILYODFUR_015237 [Ilyodon furcidens]|uniref:Uncharacterized protein n=1 Tax=Ilyodon furcidens TaxID=33524 RepID=A0ABV0TUU6_9TELE
MNRQDRNWSERLTTTLKELQERFRCSTISCILYSSGLWSRVEENIQTPKTLWKNKLWSDKTKLELLAPTQWWWQASIMLWGYVYSDETRSFVSYSTYQSVLTPNLQV